MTIALNLLTGPDEVAARSEALASVYRAAFGAPGYDEDEDAVRSFVDEQLPRHAGREGFRLVEAVESGASIGFGYGYTGERGQWWTDRIAGLAPPEIVDTWLGGHFELVELAVLPAAQGRGVGRLLHDRLLSGLPHERALLTTYVDERPATRLYRRLGWQVLVTDLDGDSALYGLRLGPSSGRSSTTTRNDH